MVTPVRAAVIGCGRMGAFTSPAVRDHSPACWFPLAHAEAMASHPDVELVALADVHAEAVERAAAHYRVGTTYQDPLRLICEVRPDLIGLATRTIGRANLVEAAVAAGTCALHIEKPLCNSMFELQRLERLFEREDLFITYGTIRRLLAPYRTAKSLAESGEYGALRQVDIAMGHGQLYWTHPHGVDMLLFAAGCATVESVMARLTQIEHGNAPMNIVSDPRIESMTVLFSNGIEGRISRAAGCDVHFHCERATISIEADGRDCWIYEARNGEPYARRFPLSVNSVEPIHSRGSLEAIALLVDCLKGNQKAQTEVAEIKRDILLGQRILFAAVQSHLSGNVPVSPVDVADDWVIQALTGASYA
jgi:scyllo-inositol 2-dehydrogenase (NAD+)